MEIITSSHLCEILCENKIQIDEQIYSIEERSETTKSFYNQNQEDQELMMQLKGTYVDIFSAINFAPKILELFKLNELSQYNKNGKTPLNYAISNQNIGSISILLSMGADVNLIDGRGIPPFKELTKQKKSDTIAKKIFELLFKTGRLDLNKTYKGKTLFSTICGSGKLMEFHDLLQKNGGKICVPLSWDKKRLILLGHKQRNSMFSVIPFDIIKIIIRYSSDYIHFAVNDSYKKENIQKISNHLSKITEVTSIQELEQKSNIIEKKLYENSKNPKEYEDGINNFLLIVDELHNSHKNFETYSNEIKEIKKKYTPTYKILLDKASELEKDESINTKNAATILKNKILDMQEFLSKETFDYWDYPTFVTIQNRMDMWGTVFRNKMEKNKKRIGSESQTESDLSQEKKQKLE